MGWSQQNANEFPDVYTTRTIQSGDINMTHLGIQHSNGHRHKTPAIATCFTFYTTVSPLRRKYMEERRERVIRLSHHYLLGQACSIRVWSVVRMTCVCIVSFFLWLNVFSVGFG